MANINIAKERLLYIDNAKALGILLVIIGHCESINSIPYLRGMIYSFHMPFFFILSGMFIKPLAFKESVRKYFKTLMAFYIKTQILILVILLLINIYFWEIDSLAYYLSDWMKKLLFIDFDSSTILNRQLTGPIWFLFALFWGSTIYAYLKTKYNELDLFVITLGIIIATYHLSHLLCLPFYLLQGLLCVFFLYLGGVLYKYAFFEYKVSYICILILTMVWLQCALDDKIIDFARCQLGLGIYSIIGSIAITIVIIYLIKKCDLHMQKIGKNSIYILCGHSIVYYFQRLFAAQINSSIYETGFLIECSIQIIMAIVIGMALKKLYALRPLSQH